MVLVIIVFAIIIIILTNFRVDYSITVMVDWVSPDITLCG